MTEFYVENGVGKRIADVINLFTANHGCQALIQHEVHPQMQLPQDGDEWWIEEASREGFVIAVHKKRLTVSPPVASDAVPHFQLVTVDGDALGAVELGRPDWPVGSVIFRGQDETNLESCK